MLFDPQQGRPRASSARCEDLKERASAAVDAGYTIVILSDRGADRDRAPIPSLLATAGVHHHLVREGTRTRCALVVESGDAREVHHCALLLGYGAGVVNPYLAFETLDDMIQQRLLVGITHEKAVKQLHQGAQQGHPQGDVQDGHLDARRAIAARRSSRRSASTRRSSTATSPGPRRASAASASTSIADGGAEAARAARSRRGPARRPTSNGAASISGGATASITCSTRTRSSSCSTRRAAASTAIFKEYSKLVDDQSRDRATLRGLLELRAGRRSRFRSTRSSRSMRSSSASRPARCPTGRSARKRTRRWRSR